MTVPPVAPPTQTRAPDPRLVPGAVYALFLLVWVFFLMATVMGAAYQEHDDSLADTLLPVVAAYPVVAGVSTVAARRAVRAGRDRAARIWNLLPLPWVVAGVATLVWALS